MDATVTSTPDHACLAVAGVHFSMTCSRPIGDRCPSAAYAEFTLDGAPTGGIDVPVVLIAHPMTGLSRFSRCFDAGDMWSLFRDGDTRYVVHTGWGIESPMWAAEFLPDAASIRVHCGGVLLNDDGGAIVVSSPMRYPLDQILLTYVLARCEGVLLHSAGILCGGKLWLLAGKSRAGKSTAAGLLKGHRDIALLSDDRIVVRRIGDAFMGYGTPWPGEARMAANRQAPLGGILFLRQSDQNQINELPSTEALARLLPVASVPWYEPELFPDVLAFCGAVVTGVPTYELEFRPDAEAAAMLIEFMKEASA